MKPLMWWPQREEPCCQYAMELIDNQDEVGGWDCPVHGEIGRIKPEAKAPAKPVDPSRMDVVAWAEASIIKERMSYGLDPEKLANQCYGLKALHGDAIPLECYFLSFGRIQAMKRLIKNLKEGLLSLEGK